jgi:hypothetical protein
VITFISRVFFSLCPVLFFFVIFITVLFYLGAPRPPKGERRAPDPRRGREKPPDPRRGREEPPTPEGGERMRSPPTPKGGERHAR